MSTTTITLDGVRLSVDYTHHPAEWEGNYLRSRQAADIHAIRVGTDSQPIDFLDDRLDEIETLVLIQHRVEASEYWADFAREEA